MRGLSQEFRFALRGLWRTKAFTVAAVLTLALGITGTTVMFALIESVLLRPLPVHQQDRLILAWKDARPSGSARYPFGNTEIEAVARASRLLHSAAGVTRNGAGQSVVTDGSVSYYANVGLVTGGFFDVLGVDPILGRRLTPDDDRDGAENVVVITSGMWQRTYGRLPTVIGRRVLIDERPFTIVGVMPSDLDYPTGVEIWRTTTSVPTNGPFGDAARREVNLIGRLRPNVTLEQAASEIAALSHRLAQEASPGQGDFIPVVRLFADVVVGDARVTLVALFAAVGFVLLIATANVANLLLMRGEGRRGELAVRAALGATRVRIVSQVLAESAIVAMLAGLVGVAVAGWSVRALLAIAPEGLPRVEAIRIDRLVILFSIAVVFITTLAAGLAPILSSLRADLVSTLRSGGQGITGAVAARGRRALVVAQVALAVTVLTAAGLLIRSVLKLQAIDLGIPAERLVLLDLFVPPSQTADRDRHGQFLDEAIGRLEALAPISAATPVNLVPFSDRGWDVPKITGEGQDETQATANPSLNLESIHPNYFATLQIRIVRGRAFTSADRDKAPAVAIVSEDVAAALWPQQDPIGKRLKFGGVTSTYAWRTVVGVASRTRYRTLTAPRPTLYLPAAQFQMTATKLVVRTSASLELLSSLVADQLPAVDPDVRLMRLLPFSEMLNRPLARPRFNAFLLTIFGVAALVLCAVGLYAVMAAHVRQRHREIAIRVALGATAVGVRRFVLAEAVRLAGLGAVIGLAGAAASTSLLRSMLFEVDPLDPSTMIAAAALLVAATALASYLPVRRATRVDPVATLRSS